MLSGSHMAAKLTNRGSTVEVCNTTTLWIIPFTGICALMMVCGPYKYCTEWLLCPLLLVGRASCLSFSCPQAIPSIWWGTQFRGAGREPPDLPYMVGRGLLFQVVLQPMTQSTPNLWWA